MIFRGPSPALAFFRYRTTRSLRKRVLAGAIDSRGSTMKFPGMEAPLFGLLK